MAPSLRGSLFALSLSALSATGVTGCFGFGCDAAGGDSTQGQPISVPPTAATLDVQLGTGTDAFEPLDPDASVSLVHGPQGGQHVWASIRVADTSIDAVQCNLSSRYADTGEPAGDVSGWTAVLSTPMGGARTHAGLRNYLKDVPEPRLVVLRVEVVAPDGRHGADERTVRLVP